MDSCAWCDKAPQSNGCYLVCPVCRTRFKTDLWDERQRVTRLGMELHAAIERGRRLHPWVDPGVQLDALRDECAELTVELRRAKVDVGRAVSEAVDVFVTAARLREGR